MATMRRSSRSSGSSSLGVGAPRKRKAQDTLPDLSARGSTDRPYSGDEIMNLAKGIISGARQGVWWRVFPIDGDMYGMDTAVNQDWEILQPVLLKAGLISAQKHGAITKYRFEGNYWDMLSATLDSDTRLELSPFRRRKNAREWFFCVGKPEHKSPEAQMKAIARKKFAPIAGGLSSRRDDTQTLYRQHLKEVSRRAKEEEIEAAQTEAAKLNSLSKGPRTPVSPTPKEMSQLEKTIEFALALDLSRTPRMERTGEGEIKLHDKAQAKEEDRFVVALTACQWGYCLYRPAVFSSEGRGPIAK